METLPRLDPQPTIPPEIYEPVEKMIDKLKDIQKENNGRNKAFLMAGDWLRNLHIEAMESGDFNYRLKTWQFCLQIEEVLDLLNQDPNNSSTHPKELPGQQQILASMAFYQHHNNGQDEYLDNYKEWIKKHRSHMENENYKDPLLEEIRSPNFPQNLSIYEESIWSKS